MSETTSEKFAEEKAEYNIVNKIAELAPEVKENVRKYGKIPVIHVPKKDWVKPMPEPGLKSHILQATSEQEVKNLLKKGKTEYKTASQKTIRKWQSAADRRISELSVKK